jgi:2-keto-4-pentenoate hydratase/2-oxohepta-3-ene-1,7-dioic acid hydratase in catechol pathway
VPEKIVGVGLNYHDHAAEQGVAPPSCPILFAKWPNTLVSTGEPIRMPSISQKLDYEAELGVVIGRRACRVKRADAFDYVAAFCAVNDVTARDIQLGDGQWVRGKSLDTLLPIGDFVSAADVPDPQNLRIQSILNGEVMQDSTTAEQIFGVDELVEFITEAITLVPGDLILTGTPAGVGAFRDPPIWLQPGDEITVEIEGIGSVTNPVLAS